ncbi:hypothetical protein CapIbe_010298 [Capra ibex]
MGELEERKQANGQQSDFRASSVPWSHWSSRKASVQEKWEEAKNPKRGNQRGKVENLKVCQFHNLARTDLHLSCRSGPLGGDKPRNSVQFWFYCSSSPCPHPKNFFKNSN